MYCVRVKVLDHGLILCYSYIIYMLSMLEGLSWNIVLINVCIVKVIINSPLLINVKSCCVKYPQPPHPPQKRYTSRGFKYKVCGKLYCDKSVCIFGLKIVRKWQSIEIFLVYAFTSRTWSQNWTEQKFISALSKQSPKRKKQYKKQKQLFNT